MLQLDEFQHEIITFKLFAAFLEDSEYETEIHRDPDLKNLVAPTLFPPSIAAQCLENDPEFWRCLRTTYEEA